MKLKLVMWVGIADKVFKVKCWRARSQRSEMHFSADGYKSTHGRPSVVRAAEACISMAWRRRLFVMLYDYPLAWTFAHEIQGWEKPKFF